MKYDGDDTYTFASGRTVYANCGIIGLGPGLEIAEGYDGNPDPDARWFSSDKPWTDEECAEIADMMIERWQRWKEGGRPPPESA